MNASTSGLSTIIPIYLLQLGGSVREVAMALFLFNLASTLGAVFWGRIMDLMHWRSNIIAICSMAVAIAGVSMLFSDSILLLMVMSAVVGFFSIGPGPVTNLLVMETSPRNEWIKTFSWTSLISCVGLVIAMVAGYVWLMAFSAQSYALVCAAIAVASMVLTSLFVKDRTISSSARSATLANTRRMTDALKAYSISGTIMHLQAILEAASSQRNINLHKVSKRTDIIFFAGSFLFFLSSNLVFTPYTPFLKDNGISDSEVFLAYTVLHLSKVFFLPFNNGIVAKIGEQKMGRWSYVPRMSAIVLMLAAALLLAGNSYYILMMTLLAFVAIDIAFSLWSTTTTYSLLRIIPEGKKGSTLGINGGVVGAGLLVGSVLAGELSAGYGYPATFALAIAFLALSFVFIKKFFAMNRISGTWQEADIKQVELVTEKIVRNDDSGANTPLELQIPKASTSTTNSTIKREN